MYKVNWQDCSGEYPRWMAETYAEERREQAVERARSLRDDPDNKYVSLTSYRHDSYGPVEF